MNTEFSRKVPNKDESRAGRWAWLTATFLGIGWLRPGPGTWASAAAVLLWWLISNFIAPEWRTATAITIAGGVILVGIPAATRIVRQSGDQDPSFVVIDEVAGQMIAMVAVPQSWKSLLASFILFRAFDIAKPPPLRRLEKFPEGTGIMLDDIGAGLYALAIMQALLHFGMLS